MGDRSERTTRRFQSSDLIAQTKKPIVEQPVPQDDDPLADWSDVPSVAAGSQPEALPATSRTQTVSDPMATALLAEVARRTKTIEMDPLTVEAARNTQEIDRAVLERALRDSQQMPAFTDSKRRAK